MYGVQVQQVLSWHQITGIIPSLHQLPDISIIKIFYITIVLKSLFIVFFYGDEIKHKASIFPQSL